MPSILSETESLKIIYKDIINGYSFFEDKSVYVKHLNDLENAEIARKKLNIFDKHRKNGLLSEEEKLAQLIETNQWDKSKEEEILNYRYIIMDNEKNLKNIIPEQRHFINKVIQDNKDKLNQILNEKKQLLNRTADDFADRDGYNYLVYISLYKDDALKNRLFDDFEDFEDVEQPEMLSYLELIEKTMNSLSEENIRKISVLSFFLNSFSYSKENIFGFIGKPLVLLTPFQTLLFSLGSRNLNILSQAEAEPPALLSDIKIDDIVLWFDRNYQVLISKRNAHK